jgi:hypothetical protein
MTILGEKKNNVTTIISTQGARGPAGKSGDITPELLALAEEVRALKLAAEAARLLAEQARDAAIAAAGGNGNPNPQPTPAPVFTTQPSVTPNIGPIGTTYTANSGVVTNGTITSRAWLLNGTSIGMGMSVMPNAAGTLTYQETATGAGGTTLSAVRSATVSAPVVTPPDEPEEPEEPENPGDVIDLTPTGAEVFYAQPNAYTPLNLNVPAEATGITLSRSFTDSELKLRVQEETTTLTPAVGGWRTNAITGPYAVTGDGINAAATMQKNGTGAATLRNGNILLAKDQFLATGALGMNFVDTGNPATAFTPPSFTYTFKGVTPGGSRPAVILGDMSGPDGVVMNFHLIDWGRSMGVSFGRPGNWTTINSDDFATNLNDANHTISFTYTDDPAGPGGTVTFFADGVQLGVSKPAPFKPRFAPGCYIQVNASDGNTTNSNANVEVESIEISYGKPVVTASYVAVPNGAITAAKLNALVVDATSVTTTQPSRTLTYQIGSQPAVNKNIVVGEVAVASIGSAYRAVLEDWSTGAAVPHANQLVMTRPAAQSVTFEDATLAANQGKWNEVEPQGPAPIIDGIRYGCQGIRQGNYVMFQFHYSIDRPTEPFGNVEGLNTYMRPHKWAIYDKAGTLIERIEQPDGKPLNPCDTTPIWEGQYDGRSVARVSADNRWYPHGTVRSTIIWRNGKPPAYDQTFIDQNLPVFDIPAPFFSHTDGSVNGFDLRIYVGGNSGAGQSNGFANWKIMPWKYGTYDYESIKSLSTTTKDPWKNIYTNIGTTGNAALWLNYTPFNSCGRSPISGPGGTRDDRQIIPAPVAEYMNNVIGKRRQDELPLKDIALDYMTSYASDAYHGVEGGRLRPLYKDSPRRAITLRNHYYGSGEHNIPEDSGFFVQSGRLDGTTASQNPTTVHVPYGGATDKKPYFGFWGGDQSHAHQYPHWGSMLWKSPEFAMLGTACSDQCRMYNQSILDSIWTPAEYASRDKAWLFMHAALLWKTASKNSTRLYSRAEIMDWVVTDFEAYHDRYITSTPGFQNPPTNIRTGSEVNQNAAIFAGAALFGPVRWDDSGLGFSGFQIGYWLSALHAAHKLGFLAALRAASPKVATVVDFLIGLHRKRVTGQINGGMLLNPLNSDYEFRIWTPAMIATAGGNAGNLAATYGDAATAQGPTPSWDTRKDGASTYDRDGQSMDQLLAAPSLLKDMGLSGTDLDQAEATATAYRQSKIDQEAARGYATAGTGWFRSAQTTNMPPLKRVS